MVEGVGQIQVGHVQLIDGGDGRRCPAWRRPIRRRWRRCCRSLFETTGVDITALLARGRQSGPTARSGAAGSSGAGGAAMSLLLSLWSRSSSSSSIVLALVIKRLLYICPPNEVLIFSGGQRASPRGARSATGSSRAGGPCASRCSRRSTRMDLTNMPIEVAGAGRLLEGRHPAQRARHRQRQDRRRAAGAGQRHRALPGRRRATRSWQWPRRRWRATCAACWRP